MTALNDPGTPDDQNEDLFDQTPLPQPGPDEPSDDDWGDSDDEEEQGGADGYQLLPQDAPQIRNQEMQGEQEVEDPLSEDDMPPSGAFSNQNSSSLELEARQNWRAEEARERIEIFSNQESTSGREIELNNDKLSAIQSAMAKISLPPACVPNWAEQISDDDWHKLIQERLGVAPPKSKKHVAEKSVDGAQQKPEEHSSEKTAMDVCGTFTSD